LSILLAAQCPELYEAYRLAIKQRCYSLQIPVMLIIDDQMSISDANANRPLLFIAHDSCSAALFTEPQRFTVAEMVYLTLQQFQVPSSAYYRRTWRPELR
jgi:hypothetical protein